MTARAWGQTLRIHTAPATILLVVASLYAAGTPSWETTILWGIVAAGAHAASFGHNVVMDQPYDADDPSKQHHPLVSGEVPFGRAVLVVHGLQAVTGAVLLWLAWPDPVALAALTVFVLAGHVYNDHFSKQSVWAWVPITVSFTALSLAAMSATGVVDPLFAGFIAAVVAFQISVLGEYKDMGTSEANLLSRLHARTMPWVADDERWVPGLADLWAGGVKGVQLGLGFALAIVAGGSAWSWGGTLLVLSAFLAGYWLAPHVVYRERALAVMGLHEGVVISAGVFLVAPLAEALVVVVVAWTLFVGGNRWLWGTVTGPAV